MAACGRLLQRPPVLDPGARVGLAANPRPVMARLFQHDTERDSLFQQEPLSADHAKLDYSYCRVLLALWQDGRWRCRTLEGHTHFMKGGNNGHSRLAPTCHWRGFPQH